MPKVHKPSRGVVAVLGVALAVTGLSTAPAASDPAAGRVVINEVYGGGGNSGATYTHDFVELHNPGDRPVTLEGLSLQYRSASGGGTGFTNLTGSVEPGGYFLVQQAQGAGGTTPLPTPDLVGTLPMSGTTGTVALVPGIGTVDPRAVSPVDMVGWGPGAVLREGTPAPGTSSTTSVARTAPGVDTDDNGADFVAGEPTPRGSGVPGPTDPTDPTDPEEPRDASIAEVQGTGETTPLAGQQVRIRGVVTAAFPTGGFDGFYVQTPGPDTTPQASDGIFVYRPGFPDAVSPGVSVEVTGVATEFGQLTQVDARDGSVSVLPDSLGTVQPKTVVPGTDCALPGTSCLTGAALDQAREQVEGELFAPEGDFTVTDVHDGSAYTERGSSSSGNFGEVGLAARSDLPLMTPTEVVDPHDADARAARAAYNEAHRVVLDDGSSWNYASAAHTDKPMAWHTPGHQVRVGAAVTFPAPVVLDQRFGWKLQPTSQVVGKPDATQPQFEQTRRAPESVEGELKLATFNVLNYFTSLGDSLGEACRSYTDRAGDPVTVRDCTVDNGPRGAWEQEDFERQEAKIVKAVNALDADVVSVEEIENSLVVDGTDRDEALSTLVAALNEAAGGERWAYVPSPAELPTGEDVIRTGIIYDPSTVETVDEAEILVGAAAFDNAREPFAQAFRPRGGVEAETFVVVVNHFKSKGSGTPDPNGQGNANVDRVAQARALVAFAEELAESRDTDKVFLTGDFNAYSMEDPIKVLEEAGYTNLSSSFPGAEKSYSFDGMSGSLDHVLASAAAEKWVEEVDVWESNANETVLAQYSRHNANVTQLVDDTEFSASDHNPEIVGFTPSATETVDLQILSSNDFHGRLGAAPALAGALGQLRADEENTLFVSAGDIIGASTFESFIARDKPAIDVMNALGLSVAATGNHEFDAGYADLTDRVMAPYDPEANPYGGAEWQYLAANLRRRDDGSYALGDSAASPGTSDGATWMTEVDGVNVGFVGAVTEDLGTLVPEAGIDELEITSIVDEVNRAADRLTAAGADVVVLLAHEGAQAATLEEVADEEKAFGRIVAGVDEDVDAIFSGHTHLRYAHVVDGRPVLSGGEYGTHLSRLVLSVAPETGEVTVGTAEVVDVAQVTPTAPEALELRAEVQGIVDAANAAAEVLGAEVVGKVDGPLRRAVLATGAENRGGESTLGNLVAEVHRWATREPAQGGAEIAFMNPGGLRADLLGSGDGTYPTEVTYRQAAAVQPFANTLVNMDLTGAQVKEVLEQQWQRDGDGNVPTRPFLRLGASRGFTYTYDATRPEGDRITGMWLDGQPIESGRAYSVTVNSFLAGGGDNFRAFAAGTNRNDTGRSDLTAMVDYMAATGTVEVDHSQRAVGLVVGDAPVRPGATVDLEVSSWSFSATGSVRDDRVEVLLDDDVVGSAPVDHTVSAEPFDETGTATVSVTLPATLAAGEHTLTLRGPTTGTTVTTTVVVEAGQEKVTPTLTVTGGKKRVPVGSGVTTFGVRVAGGVGSPSGTVRVLDGKRVVGQASVVDGRARVRVTGLRTLGRRTLTVRYSGDEQRLAASTTVTVRVVRVAPRVTLTLPGKVAAGERKAIAVRVRAGELPAAGKVRVTVRLKGRTTVRTVRLRDGGATTRVLFHRQGNATVRVVYLGSTKMSPASRTARVKVTRR